MSVLGTGERSHPVDGNTTLVTLDLDGRSVRTPLWISQFATDLNLQIDSAQLRTGLSHRPIRLTERMLVFSTLWNVADREKYVALIATIRTHWARNLNDERPFPMKLIYYGGNKTWLGFIEAASIGYAVTDVILTYQFQMRIIPELTNETTEVSRVIGWDAPYAPTSQDIQDFGNDWYDQGQFAQDSANRLRGTSQGTGNAPPSHTNPTSTGGGNKR